jgi:hypothetical protein
MRSKQPVVIIIGLFFCVMSAAAQCPRESDSLQYFDLSASTIVFQQALPTVWWGVRISPPYIARIDSAFIGFGIAKSPTSTLISDTLQVRILEATLPTITSINTAQFIIPPPLIGTVPDDYYLMDYVFIGTYPNINPKRDFWLSWRLRGPSSHTAHILLRTPAINPKRSMVIGNAGDTTSVSYYIRNQFPGTTADLWADVRPCYIQGVPVELSSFTARCDGRIVILDWSTATETDNYGFDIERAIPSSDGNALLWQKIAFVPGHGTTLQQQRYVFEDVAAYALTDLDGVIRYRLRQIDYDGTVHMTPVREIRFPTSIKGYELHQSYPNPVVSDRSSIVVPYVLPSESHVVIALVDALGRNAMTLLDGVKPSGPGSVTFDASRLAPGSYRYVLSTGDITIVRSLIIAK